MPYVQGTHAAAPNTRLQTTALILAAQAPAARSANLVLRRTMELAVVW
ncbi:hypothetical protein ACH4S8_34940 [Streptomyces sp. NPDC021080]